MGFQNLVKTDEIDYNQRNNIGSKGRTSKTSETVNGATKAQFERLGTSNSVDTRGVTANYGAAFSAEKGFYEDKNQATVGRTTNTIKQQNTQVQKNLTQLTKTGPTNEGTK